MIGKLPICPFLDGIAIIVEHDLLRERGDQFRISNAFGNPAGALPESGSELFAGQFKPVTGIEQGKTIRLDINRIDKPVVYLTGTFLGLDPAYSTALRSVISDAAPGTHMTRPSAPRMPGPRTYIHDHAPSLRRIRNSAL